MSHNRTGTLASVAQTRYRGYSFTTASLFFLCTH